jgi:hypothetical protein
MVYGIVLPTFVRKKHPTIWLSPGHFSPSGSRPVLPGPFWRSGCTAPRRRPLKGPLIHDVARQGFVHIYIIYTHNCVCINIYVCVCICMYVYIYVCVCACTYLNSSTTIAYGNIVLHSGLLDRLSISPKFWDVTVTRYEDNYPHF